MSLEKDDLDVSDEVLEKIINPFYENYNKVKKEIVKLLRIKYSLEIVSENPLELKKLSTRYNSATLFYNPFSKKLTEDLKLCEFRWAVGLGNHHFLLYYLIH